MTIRVLHISDLHARADWTDDQQEIVNAMLDDVELLAEDAAPDLVVFTGDLAFSGAPEEFELARRILLDPLVTRLGIPPAHVVIVPGNHDVRRSDINPIYELGLRQALTDREAVNALIDRGADGEHMGRLAAFDAFASAYFGASAPQAIHPLAITRQLEVGGVTIGVAGLNSAWRSAGDGDHGRIVVGDRQVRNALETLKASDLRLVAVHHPLGWLADFDAVTTRQMLEKSGTIVMSGHEHTPDPTSEMTARGQAVYSRAGCLYDSHRYPNAYTLIDIDLDRRALDLNLRSWTAEGQRAFVPAVHLAEQGRLSFALPGLPSKRNALGVRTTRSSVPPLRDISDTPIEPPEGLKQAASKAYTPLYKSYNDYTFEVLGEGPSDHELQVRLGYAYAIVNPTPFRLGHRPGLTPVRPIQVLSVTTNGEPEDLTNGDFHVERGVIVPIALEPRSETLIELVAEVTYRLPDAEVFLTYLPSLAFRVVLEYDTGRLRFIGESLMPEPLRPRTETLSRDRCRVVYESSGPVLAYWGLKLDWRVPKQED